MERASRSPIEFDPAGMDREPFVHGTMDGNLVLIGRMTGTTRQGDSLVVVDAPIDPVSERTRPCRTLQHGDNA